MTTSATLGLVAGATIPTPPLGQIAVASKNGTILSVVNDTGQRYAIAHYHIQTITLGSNGTFTFTVPTDFKHLLLLGQVRGTFAAAAETLLGRFNGDSSTNYYYNRISGVGGVVSSGALNVAYLHLGPVASANSPAGSASALNLFICNYQGAFFKQITQTLVGNIGAGTDGSGTSQMTVNEWKSTAAISSIYIYGYNAANLLAGSTLSLIGIAGD